MKEEVKFTIRFMRRSCSTIFFTLQLSASTRRQPGSAASRRSVTSKRKGNAGISMWSHLFSWGRSSHIRLVSGTPSALAATASTCTCQKQTNLQKRSPGRRKTRESQTLEKMILILSYLSLQFRWILIKKCKLLILNKCCSYFRHFVDFKVSVTTFQHSEIFDFLLAYHEPKN